MRFVVLNVADPFSPIGPRANGDAERTLTQLDNALVQNGHDSIVIAGEGSITEGILLSTAPADPRDYRARNKAQSQYRYLLQKFLEKWPIDLIHMHGTDFYEYLPPPGMPVLVTLHQPIEEYPKTIFELDRLQIYLHCISSEQHNDCPPCSHLLPPIEPGGAGMIEKYFSVYEQLVTAAREKAPVNEFAVV